MTSSMSPTPRAASPRSPRTGPAEREDAMGECFGFYGRVSTEDMQDPVASRLWQLDRARTIIPAGSEIVAEFFDIDLSRSLPWARRPEASRLLAALADSGRGFSAVVIGEPARAFHGNQYGLTFPLFVHYGVDLWVPEVGGRIDPDSDAHDLMMQLYGGMSKGERNRIRTRVRASMASQTQHQGRFLGGRPPYGYRLEAAGPHPNPRKAADGAALHQLVPDPDTAPVVVRIFEEYAAGRGFSAIARGLNESGVPSPAAHDPIRNPHRDHTAWRDSAIRAILTNPRYDGYQVWGRAPRAEILLDPTDVAAGVTTVQRWAAEDQWCRSTDPSHDGSSPGPIPCPPAQRRGQSPPRLPRHLSPTRPGPLHHLRAATPRRAAPGPPLLPLPHHRLGPLPERRAPRLGIPARGCRGAPPRQVARRSPLRGSRRTLRPRARHQPPLSRAGRAGEGR